MTAQILACRPDAPGANRFKEPAAGQKNWCWGAQPSNRRVQGSILMAIQDLDLDETELDGWFVEAVNSLARGEGEDLDGHLVSVGAIELLDSTATSCQVHFLARDGNGRPLVAQLARMLVNQIVDFCIPRSRIDEAERRFVETGSSDQFVSLNREARDLFTSLDNSGEGGELLLAVLLERLLGAPQILCKMSLKTNSEMHVHGTDGVHVKALGAGRLAVYWGESKLHATVSSAIGSAFESIGPFLRDEGDGASQRDLLLVRDHLDSGEPELDDMLREYFTEGHIRGTLREVRGASLVGFSLEDYPEPHDSNGVVAEVVARAIQHWQSLIRSRVAATELERFELVVFCLPLPSVSAFREAVKEAIGI